MTYTGTNKILFKAKIKYNWQCGTSDALFNF